MAALFDPNLQQQLPSQQKREREESSDKLAFDSQDSSKKPRIGKSPPSFSTLAAAKSSKLFESPVGEPKIPFSLLLSDIHPSMTLAEDSSLALEQIIRAFILALKTSEIENTTLPVAQNCISTFLKDCEGLLEYAQKEGTIAVTQSATRAETLKGFTESIEKQIGGNMENKKAATTTVVNERKLNDLILILLKEDNKEDAQLVIDIDFKKYDLKPTDETLQIMSRADELRNVVRAIKSGFSAFVSLIFQTSGKGSLTEPALIFLSAVAEYLAAELLELAGHAASDSERTTILPCDVQTAMRNDEEFDKLCTKLNISNKDYFPVFQLISGVDGQVTELLLFSLMEYWQSSDGSSAFTLLSTMDCSSELNVIIPNVTTSAIQVVYDWHFGNDFVEKWKQLKASDPTIFANVLLACDFLGCDKLSNELFQSFEDSGNNPIDTIRSCFQIIPNFARILLYRGLCVRNEAAAEEFLINLTTKNIKELSYVELQLCDGMYLSQYSEEKEDNYQGAQSYYCKSQHIEPMVGLSPEIHYELCEMNKDGFFNKSGHEIYEWDRWKWKVTTHLGLKQWTQNERQRRIKQNKEEANAHRKCRWDAINREGVSLASLDQALWDAVSRDDLDAAKNAYNQGASANLWFAAGVATDLKREFSNEQYGMFIRKDINVLLKNAAEPHLMTHGLTTLMKASQNNSLAMMNWLIDVQCKVNDREIYEGNKGGSHPSDDYYEDETEIKHYSLATYLGKVFYYETYEDQNDPDDGTDVRDLLSVQYGDGGRDFNEPYHFGTAPALACATTPEAVQLLLARGAKVNVSYTPANNKNNAVSILATHLVLRHGSDRYLIVRALIQHGADVNKVYDSPCFDVRDGNPPICCWPSIVASGDVSLAKELIEKYSADVNWSPKMGETVLQIAIMSENVNMIKMLLQCEDIKVNRIDQSDNKRASSLSVALGTGNKQIIALLKDAGATSHPENASIPVTPSFHNWNLDDVGSSGGSSTGKLPVSQMNIQTDIRNFFEVSNNK
jgi:histone H2A